MEHKTDFDGFEERPYDGAPAEAGPQSASLKEARLVAFLLGELDADEQIDVAQELERDADLRALADGLRATIGLVRTSGVPAPVLSVEAARRLQQAAARRPRRLMPRLALAAGALLAVGAAWALLGNRPEVRNLLRERIAQAPASGPPSNEASKDGRMAGRAASAQEHQVAVDTSRMSKAESDVLISLGYQTSHGGGGGGSPAQEPREKSRDEATNFALGVHSAGQPAVELSTGVKLLPESADSLVLGGQEQRGALLVTETPPAAAAAKSTGPQTLGPASGGPLPSVPSAGGGGGTSRGDLNSIPLLSGFFQQDEFKSDRPALTKDLEARRQQLALQALGYLEREGAGAYDSDQEEQVDLPSAPVLAERLGLDQAGLKSLLIGLGYLPNDYTGDLSDELGRIASSRLFEKQRARSEVDRLLQSTCRLPGESLDLMFFRQWGTRPYVETREDPLSTFSIDVDTASYTLCRGMLDQGVLPQRDAVRPEEFINYFDAEVPAPTSGVFGLHADLCPSPFNPEEWLLRVVVKAKQVAISERPPLALSFVIDTSGSMEREGRLELVKASLRQLLTRLDGRDTVSLIAFAQEAREVLPATSADQRGRFEAALQSLSPQGGTNVEAGLVAGYQAALQALDPNKQNRVVLLSDGVGNIGETSAEGILKRVQEARAQGIYLNTIGVGLGNHNDAFLEQLADRGDGQCNYVDDAAEARKAFVENFTGAFVTVAKDVKIQIEFDPAQVESYRQIGYENRQLADRAFRDDSVDAGEVPAGKSVVALYRLKGVRFAEPMLLGSPEPVGVILHDVGSLATLRVRYLPPETNAAAAAQGEAPAATELELPITASMASAAFEAAPLGLQRAAAVAQFAELLRRSYFARGTEVKFLGQQIARLAGADQDPEFRAFAALFQKNQAAFAALLRPANEVQGLLDQLQALRFELEQERETPGTPDAQRLADLEARVQSLEDQIRQTALAASSER